MAEAFAAGVVFGPDEAVEPRHVVVVGDVEWIEVDARAVRDGRKPVG